MKGHHGNEDQSVILARPEPRRRAYVRPEPHRPQGVHRLPGLTHRRLEEPLGDFLVHPRGRHQVKAAVVVAEREERGANLQEVLDDAEAPLSGWSCMVAAVQFLQDDLRVAAVLAELEDLAESELDGQGGDKVSAQVDGNGLLPGEARQGVVQRDERRHTGVDEQPCQPFHHPQGAEGIEDIWSGSGWRLACPRLVSGVVNFRFVDHACRRKASEPSFSGTPRKRRCYQQVDGSQCPQVRPALGRTRPRGA